MKILRWTVIGLVVIGAAAYGLFKVFEREAGEVLFKRAIETNIARNTIAELADGLHVFICGAGSPLPDPTRAGPCLGVVAGDTVMVVDAGTGGVRNLARMGFAAGAIDRILLTHLHSDHIDGLGEFLLQVWIGSARTEPVPIYGPAGTQAVVDGFNAAYRIDSRFRTLHHGEAVAPPSGFGGRAEEIAVGGGSYQFYNDGDLTITAFLVSHSPVEPAFGYRFDYKGRSLVISGDTKYDLRLIEAAKGADVLFHEALQPRMVKVMEDAARAVGNERIAKILFDIPDYHTSPEEAAQSAQLAGVKELVLYHIVPPLPTNMLYKTFLGDAPEKYDGPITIGEDGMIVSLPAGSDDVTHRAVL